MKIFHNILIVIEMLGIAILISCSGESAQDTIKFTVYSQGGSYQEFSGNYQINGGTPGALASNASSNSVCYYDKEITSDDFSEDLLDTIDITAALTTTSIPATYPTMSIKVYRLDKSGNIKKVKETSNTSSQVSITYKYDEENSTSSSSSSSSKSSSSSSSE